MLERPQQGGWGAGEAVFHAFLREGPRSLGHEIVDQKMGCAAFWLLGLVEMTEIPLIEEVVVVGQTHASSHAIVCRTHDRYGKPMQMHPFVRRS